MKYGRCTNTGCDEYGKDVELQDWWPFRCEKCESDLSETAKPPSFDLKRYLLLGGLIVVLFVGVAGAYNWFSSRSDRSQGLSGEEQVDSSSSKPVIPKEAEASAIAAELDALLKIVASPSSTENEIDLHVSKVLSMCANPNIEVRFLSNQGTVTGRSTISKYMDQLRLLQESTFKVTKVYALDESGKISTIEVLETNIG